MKIKTILSILALMLIAFLSYGQGNGKDNERGNYVRVPNSARVQYEFTRKGLTTTSANIQSQINAVDAQISDLQETRDTLLVQLANVQAVEPPNAGAVQFAIDLINAGVTEDEVKDRVAKSYPNLEPADVEDVYNDAVEIINE